MPQNITLIALDLDGTTLTRGRITPRTRRALEEAIRRGVHVVVATGRVYTSLPEDVFHIEGLEYVITSNGAIITDLKQQKVIYENCIGVEPLQKALKILRDNSRYPIEVFTGGQAYIAAEVYEGLKEGGYSYLSRSYILRTRKPVEDIYTFTEEHIEHIENINVLFEHMEDKAHMRTVMEALPDLTITSSMPNNIELGGVSTSKASGLQALCGIVGADLKTAMACGDSPNDMAMITAAGLGVAMGSGEKEVQEMADLIAPSNEEEGVAWAVEKYVLGMERPAWQLALLKVKNLCLYRLRKVLKNSRLRRLLPK